MNDFKEWIVSCIKTGQSENLTRFRVQEGDMIIIDGSNTDLRIDNFTNLEEILVSAVGDSRLDNRIVTDVFLNNKLFSELYPHQAGDITAEEISSVEIRSVPLGEMAYNISTELFKVVQLMSNGSRHVALLIRDDNKPEALELLQDLLDVTRDFMSMIGVLRSDFVQTGGKEFSSRVEQISNLLAEMTEALEGEDWTLISDLLEYEMPPICEGWKNYIQTLRDGIRAGMGA